MRPATRIVPLLLTPVLGGCALPGYYGQAVNGELSLLSARVPIQSLLASPETPAALKTRLQLAAEIRRYASAQLGLPRNGSYTSYVALDRPYVSWNLFATKPYSLFIAAADPVFSHRRLCAVSRLLQAGGGAGVRRQTARPG
ncbi:MAG TPA: aminopeptidase [Gammaproteobacteria bacterium]|nr:aminopeptidase [Gammaproteobacteria bacterium]